MLQSFVHIALLVTIIAFHFCNTKYLLVELDDIIAEREQLRNGFPSNQMMGKLLSNKGSLSSPLDLILKIKAKFYPTSYLSIIR